MLLILLIALLLMVGLPMLFAGQHLLTSENSLLAKLMGAVLIFCAATPLLGMILLLYWMVFRSN
jgi:hypothetical protein